VFIPGSEDKIECTYLFDGEDLRPFVCGTMVAWDSG